MKKMKEFGTDLYNSSYNAYIENGMFYISVEASKKGLVYEYRLYDNNILLDTVIYSSNNKVAFKINRFGSLRVRVFIKDKDGVVYSFLTGFFNYTNINALSHFNHKRDLYEEGIKSLNLMLQEKKLKDDKVNHIVEKIQAISSMDFNLVKYLKEKGITNINIYGEQDEVILSKLLWINARYEKNFSVKNLFSNNPFVHDVYVPRKIPLKFIKYDKSLLLDVIIVCTSYKDEQLKENLEKTGSKVMYLTDIISEILIDKFIKNPLSDVKKNKKVTLMVGLLPTLEKVKNKSLNENNIINNNIVLKDIRNKLENAEVPTALEIFNESLDYNKEIMAPYYFTTKNGIQVIQDFRKKFVNVVNNFRLTTNLKDNFDNTIYIFGNSITFGLGSDYFNTIPSFLQRIINVMSKKYNVLNCANHAISDYDYQFDLMNSIDYQEGDIVISLLHLNPGIGDYIYLNMSNIFNRPHDLGEIFIDRTHINKVGNEKIANAIYKELETNNAFVNKKVKKAKINKVAEIIDEEKQPELTKYKEFLLKHKVDKDNIGSIVMNCNPFTLGHRFLIEKAASEVEHLYIFAVEEDKSYFPFKERFELMKLGTADLKNVTVIPSGKFIISSLTFSDYFNKEKLNTETIDMSTDVTIFASVIAPILNIKTRFVGEEPLCNVTRQYNATLNRILPNYGIDFIIIPRVNYGEEPISASRVRRLLTDKNFKEISKIVPKTTLEYLENKFK